MPTFTDQFSDPSFKKLSAMLKAEPDYKPLIKTASIGEDVYDTLPDTAFAWPEARKFPIHNAADAALSWLYVKEASDVPAVIRNRVKEVLDVYGVDVPTEKVAAVKELKDSDYLLPELKRWHVHDEKTVKLAAQALAKSSDLPVEQRVGAAVKLVKKAAALNQPVPILVEQLAGGVTSDLHVVRDWLEARSMATDNIKHAEAYRTMSDKLASVRKKTSNDRPNLIKLASSIAALDEAAGLDMYYGKAIPDPVLTVFNTTKTAEQEISLAGQAVPISKLLSVPPETYGDIFGEEIVPEIAPQGDVDPNALAVVLPTMPFDLQKVLAAQLGL